MGIFLKTNGSIAGNSFLEVLAGAAILGMTITAVFSMLNFHLKQSQQAGNKGVLLYLLSVTSTEIDAKPSQDLPATGQCVSRYYDSTGNFLLEQPPQPINSSECSQTNATDTRIKVTIKIQDSAAIDATFVPSAFLKLPTYVPSVKQVQILVGLGQGAKDAANQQPYSVTIFRRSS